MLVFYVLFVVVFPPVGWTRCPPFSAVIKCKMKAYSTTTMRHRETAEEYRSKQMLQKTETGTLKIIFKYMIDLFCNVQKMHSWSRYADRIGPCGSHSNTICKLYLTISNSGAFQVCVALNLRSHYNGKQTWFTAVVGGKSTWNKRFANLYPLYIL